jgi:hypothetical protein
METPSALAGRRSGRGFASLALLVALWLVAACGAADEGDPLPVETATPGAATPFGTPTPAASQLPVTGLVADPRSSDPDLSVALGPRPASPFEPSVAGAITLYHLEQPEPGGRLALGPGQLGRFNQTSTLLAWIGFGGGAGDGPQLRVADLWSSTILELGPAGALIGFENDQVVRVADWNGDGESIVDLVAGVRLSAEPAPYRPPATRYHLAEERLTTEGSRFTLWDGATPLLRFEALRAVVSSDLAVVALVAAGPGQANLFLIDVPSRQARFVATTPFGPARSVPLVAGDRFVVWTPDYCGEGGRDGGGTRVYDRAEDRVVELADASLWPEAFTPDGRLVTGLDGGDAIVDLERLAWELTLPAERDATVWSPDYRWAATGPAPGGDAPCP